MKKQILFTAIAALASSVLVLDGCKKDDTTSPVVTVTGGSSRTVSLNGSLTDPGATADDGSTVTSNWSSTNPDLNTTGTYTITYSATDGDGNTGNATLTVIVKNDAEGWAGNYHVADSVVGDQTYLYDQTVTVDEHINNRIHFSKFANYNNNTGIYGTVSGNNLTIPSQTASPIGSLNESHTFNGTGVKSGSNFGLTYQDTNNTAGGTVNDIAAFVKF
jgi:hypothetical protein